jgi:AraC-like DNA-binding protein
MRQVQLAEKVRTIAEDARFRVTAFAEQLKLSPTKMRRHYHRTHGCPPKRLLILLRLMRAVRLLRKGDAVKVVAIEVGFKHVSSFCRHFKAIYGLRPGQFLKKCRRPEGTPKESPPKSADRKC